MSRLLFLFDLDSTITKQEILPTIAKKNNIYAEMQTITEKTMNGEVPFKKSFIQRVNLLKDIPVAEIQDIVEKIQLNEKVVDFIEKNRSRSFIVTGNIDIWIEKLVQKLSMENHLYCSRALLNGQGYTQEIVSILDKDIVIKQMIMPFVAIGDGNNDAEMIEAAQVGIGYGGVRDIAPSVLECATHAVYDEKKLVDLLWKLV